MISRLLNRKRPNDSSATAEKKTTSFMRIWGYIILIGAYLVTIILDLVLRRIDEEYAIREISQTHFIVGQIIFLLASLLLLAAGHYSYVVFNNVQNDLTTKFSLTRVDMYRFPLLKKKKENLKSFREKLLGKHILLPTLIVSLAVMIIYLIIHLNNLPAYFPDKAVSYVAETIFLLAYIPSIFIAIMFTRLFYLVAVFYPNLRKYVETETLNLHPLHKDPTGGFGKSQNLLVFATFTVSLASFSLIFINILAYLILRVIFMEEKKTPGGFLVSGILFSLIPIVFFIFVMVNPLLKIRSMVRKFKRLKINSIIDEKSKIIEKGLQDKEKRMEEETIKELKSYDYYIDYYKSLSPWPRFFKTMSVIITTISAVISFILSIPGVSDWIKSLILPS